MASQLTVSACVPIPYFSVLGNRHLFQGGLEPHIQLSVACKADTVPILPKVLSGPYRTRIIRGHPDHPLPFCLLPSISPPGNDWIFFCSHASVSQAPKTIFPQNTAPCPHPTNPKLCMEFPLPLSCLGGSYFQQPSCSASFYIKSALSL